MNYKRYYEILTKKNKEQKNEFPQEHIFIQSRESDYYTKKYLYSGNEYNIIISNKKSKKYGIDFIGLIVEVQSRNNDYSFFLKHKDKIQAEIGSEITIEWKSKEESQNGNLWNICAKKEVDIENENNWHKYISWQINTMIKFLKIFPVYTKKIQNLKGDQMTIEEIRNNYKNFIRNTLQNEATVNSYVNKLDISFPEKLNCETLFTNTEIESLITLSNRCHNGDLEEWSQSIGNHAPRAALNKYIRFLESLLTDNLTIDISNKLDNTIKIKNIILYGAPGVGKTHNYRKLISLIEQWESQKDVFDSIKKNEIFRQEDETFQNIKNEERVEFITFHQSFGYEDFIEGFRPNENGNIQLENGIFKNICFKAKNNLDKKIYLVIDEINRGNISKVFGELITLIEESKRDDYEVTLPYSKEKFSVPSNLYIIGTMNTTDKSIALIDVALRRRFTFIKMQPNSNLVLSSFKDKFIKLNEQIKTDLGEEYQIGHSYFMNIDESELEFVLEYKIKPLLEEYYYGDEKLIEALKVIGLEE